ncbi:TPA: hypothetical protein R4193_003504 [Serratia marcescens]|uniref:hypothetical protein n=1 Tax=Serratia marcescens TaxID=615 RepID=UPI000AF8515C|nr:hypothetical protein [Serratia marcescens]EGT0503678.1 hypothetical protein [Serratia marcescens]EHT9829611.1 hypothetical protein [Serratia marcescens]EIU0970656.1 hypothetical protein [Serratia marcescens]EMB7754505.1 hypothetical protein [Serratia marcescens]MDP8611445.1 hypothetical protein [Serratia marcescens]
MAIKFLISIVFVDRLLASFGANELIIKIFLSFVTFGGFISIDDRTGYEAVWELAWKLM